MNNLVDEQDSTSTATAETEPVNEETPATKTTRKAVKPAQAPKAGKSTKLGKQTKPTKAAPAKKGSKQAQPAKKAAPAAKKAKADASDRQNKKAEVIAMMKRAKGATLAEIMETTGWQRHTVRGFVSILGSKGGHTIESEKNPAGDRTYRITK